MKEPSLQVYCPCCGAGFDLEAAWDSADGRRFLSLLMELPPSIIRPLYNYLRLFKPAKQTLKWSRILKITSELAPLIKAAQIKHKGITYSVPVVKWIDAIKMLVDDKPGTLELPLTKNAYLLAILANQAEKALAQDEVAQHALRATGYRPPAGEDLSFKELTDMAKSHAPASNNDPPKEVPKKRKPPEDFKKNLNI